MKPLHTNPEEAVTAHKVLGAKLSIGIHFGTFQLSSEGFEQPLSGLRDALTNQRLPLGSFITLHEGKPDFFRKLTNHAITP
jgi:L-ascorbate metabolism protein UlaG (beta-lactamase superfamily)